MKDTSYEVMRACVRQEQNSLSQLYEIMDANAFKHALDLLSNTSFVVTTACGSSGFAAKKLAHSLCCIECPAKFVPPSEAVHGGMGVLQPGNVLVIVSKGGKTDELLPLLDIAKEKKAYIIAVTQKEQSSIAQKADVVLRLPDCPECDKYGVMSSASFVATISIFDALMMGIMEEKDYQLSQFALIHPGGAVGKQICQ